MKFFLPVIAFIVLALTGCSDAAKLKYANKLYNEKSYAEASKVAQSAASSNERNAVLASSQFKMLQMEQAVATFGLIPIPDLSEEQKQMYCEALRQMGDPLKAGDVASSSKGASWVNDYITPSPDVKTDAKLTAEAAEFNSPDDEQTAFYYQGNMYYLSNSEKSANSSERFKWNGKPFMQIVADGSNTNVLEKLNTKANDGPVAIHETTGVIVYNRDIPSKGKKGASRVSLFETTNAKISGKESKEIEFCKGNNSYAHPAWNTSGNMLAFASNSAETKGGMDIFTATRGADGTWGNPVWLGEGVNSYYEDVYPSFLTDSLMVFSSSRTSGMGGLDMYTTVLGSDGKWSKPYLLPAPINSFRDDFYLISESNLGTYLFTTNRNGSDDIFRVNIPKDAMGPWEIELVNEKTQEKIANQELNVRYENPVENGGVAQTNDKGVFSGDPKGGMANISVKGFLDAQAEYSAKAHGYFQPTRQTLSMRKVKVADLNGAITDAATKQGLKGATVVISSGSQVDTVLTDNAGKFLQSFNIVDGEKVSIEIIKQGYLPKKFTDVAIDAGTTQIDLNALADLSLDKVKIGDDLGTLLQLNPIYFESGKWDINEAGSLELDKIVAYMITNPQFVIECGSHTDCRGSASSNMTLSSKRANSTADALVKKGIGRSRIKFKGYGETVPVNNCKCEGKQQTTCSEEELALNRRTEFRVVKSMDELLVDNSTPAVTPVASDSVYVGTPAVTGTKRTSNDEFEINAKTDYAGKHVPADIELPKEVFYSVQVGAYQGDVDEVVFNGLAPLRSENSLVGFKRYCTGYFSTYRRAEAALLELRAKGFADAFVAAYQDGKRIKVQDAQLISGE